MFAGALERPSSDRESWLLRACGSDPDLLNEVRSLVANHREQGSVTWAAKAASNLLGIHPTIQPGTRFAAYDFIELIGAGGMGEVYRARDTRLNREVAIRVLPDAFANDSDRLARFTREARVLASLNHSNIAGIFGVEDGALVMELVTGPTLAERITAGKLPVDEALSIARQIAEALDYAHAAGVIHRDLKPANVKLTADGRVNFGLAKAFGDQPAAGDPVSSPTVSMNATKACMLLGTAAYMSPEQARGVTVDKRADIWAFGAVVYEMLSGVTALEGRASPKFWLQCSRLILIGVRYLLILRNQFSG